MNLFSTPTSNLLAVQILLNARNHTSPLLCDAHEILYDALWSIVRGLRGEEHAAALLLINIESDRYWVGAYQQFTYTNLH